MARNLIRGSHESVDCGMMCEARRLTLSATPCRAEGWLQNSAHRDVTTHMFHPSRKQSQQTRRYTVHMHSKPHLPTKICPVCDRPFAWRKKWERSWDEVRYCSERCRRQRGPEANEPRAKP
jgi:hypothetical protein